MTLTNSALSNFCERWLQWMVHFIFMNSVLTFAVVGWGIWFFLVSYSPLLRYPLLLYAAWIYYDRKTAELGTRRNEWVRSWKFWKYYNDFFPAKLHKTGELPPNKNYLLGVFPHGIMSLACVCTYGSNCGGFEKAFPGLKGYGITLANHFNTPFMREIVLYTGLLPASASCLNYFLGKKKGIALALIVGGAQEAFYSKPGSYNALLSNRKGFIKIAYKNGASLVPVISFGEPDLYKQIQFEEKSIGKKIQEILKKLTGLAPVLFYGQFGVVPYRRPLNVVVGTPIDVEKIEEPTQEQIDGLHAKFKDALVNLFETEKHKYLENPTNTHLNVL